MTRNPSQAMSSSSSENRGNAQPAAFIVLGKTGSGKSSFIKLLGGKDLSNGEEPKVDSGINSCTSKSAFYQATVEGKKIILLDTPGFDDSSKDNIVVINEITQHIRSLSQIQGFVFLHDISETRFSGSQRRAFAFLKLIGEDWMGNVIVGTTMWGRGNLAVQRVREEQIRREHWGGVHKTTQLYRDDLNAATPVITDLMKLPPIVIPNDWKPRVSPEVARDAGFTTEDLWNKLNNLSFAEKLGLAVVAPIVLAPAAVVSAPVGVVAALVHLAKKAGG